MPPKLDAYIPPVANFEFAQTTKKAEIQTETGPTAPISLARSKRCAKCGEKKEENEFPRHSTSSDGRASYCRSCKNELAKERRFKDPIARITHYTVTRIKNEWPKESVPKDIHTNLERYLGYRLTHLKKALREDVRVRYDKSLVRCFKEGYHLDHIKPHSSFDSKQIGDEEFKKCWAISNLRLIPAKENLQKGAKQDFYAETEVTAEDDKFSNFDEEGEHNADLIG